MEEPTLQTQFEKVQICKYLSKNPQDMVDLIHKILTDEVGRVEIAKEICTDVTGMSTLLRVSERTVNRRMGKKENK